MSSTYRTHFGKRLVSYEDSGSEPVTLHFKDGSTAKCDVLVGADGIKSAVRRTMFNDLAAKAQDENQAAAYRKHVEATWSGVVAYRSLVQAEAFKADYPNHTSAGASPICVRWSYLWTFEAFHTNPVCVSGFSTWGRMRYVPTHHNKFTTYTVFDMCIADRCIVPYISRSYC